MCFHEPDRRRTDDRDEPTLRTLIILRAHRPDAETLAAYDLYAALRQADTVICCDERGGPIDMGERAKIGFDVDRLQALGLFVHPRCGWRCGDYAYYVTRASRPDYDFYWLTEPDVVINATDLEATFRALNASDADLLAPRLYERDERWGWSRTMRKHYPIVYGCIFPITRLSARAIDHLHAARHSAVPSEDAAVEDWPNDEVFVATELMNNGFAGCDIAEQVPGVYTRDSLRTGLPHDREKLREAPADGMLYHPVRDFTAWLEGKSEWAVDQGRYWRDGTATPERAQVMTLLGIAVGCMEHADLHDAAFHPLMLARGRPVSPPPFVDYEAKRARATRLLTRHFGFGRNGREMATAFLLGEPNEAALADMAGPGDFPLLVPEPLARPPGRHALPYAFDFDERTLLFTVHPRPEKVLSSPSVLTEQRQAAVGCKVSWRHLDRFFAPPSSAPRLLLTDHPAAAEELRALGFLPVVRPPALMQLAAMSDHFDQVRPQWREAMLWAAIVPAAQMRNTVLLVAEDIEGLRLHLENLMPGFTIFRRVADLPGTANAVR